MTQAPLYTLALEELAPLLRDRQISPVELTESYLRRIEALDGKLNAFVTVTADQALAEARRCEAEIGRGDYYGPLHGIPLAHKDLFDTAGVRTTASSKIYADRVPTADAAVVAQLRQAGAIVLGKTNLHEFAYGVTTESSHFGPTHNPWKLGRVPGGSSGGSAAAVAAGLCPVATGTDTGCSVRIPAALCGIVGLKPTYGRVSCRGVLPLSWSMDHVGPLSRTVYGAAVLLAAMAGYDPDDPGSANVPVPDYLAGLADRISGVRIGLDPQWALTGIPEVVRTALQGALATLQALGAEIVEVTVPGIEQGNEAALIMQLAEATAVHEEYLRTRPDDYAPDVRARLENGVPVRGVDYARARRSGERVRRGLEDLLQRVDLLATPCGIPAPELGQRYVEINGETIPVIGALTRYTRLFNLTGLPGIVVPCGFSDEGLPIGFQLVGRAWDEMTLLRVAQAYETATGFPKHRPPI